MRPKRSVGTLGFGRGQHTGGPEEGQSGTGSLRDLLAKLGPEPGVGMG